MKLKKIILIISIMILLIMSSCSLLIDGYEREVGYNSICWEDNDHILVYANIGAYDDYTTIGGGARNYIWGGGEIWRIDVNTGEKELLMRKKEWDYAISVETAKIVKSSNMLLISETFITNRIRDDFNGWDSIGNYVLPVISDDKSDIVVVQKSNDYESEYIKKYNINSQEEEILYETINSVKSLDYNYGRNLLLINNIKLVDLNTGDETILLEWGDTIDGRMIYSDGGIHGDIFRDTITIDVRTQNEVWNKVYIDPNDYEQKTMRDGFMGILSPNGLKGAHGHNSDGGATGTIDIYSISGFIIKEIVFDKEQI